MSTHVPIVEDPEAPSGAIGAPSVENETLSDYVRGRIVGLRSGELGNIPIMVGIILIAIYFQSRNSNFLTAGNFVNLIVQMAPIAVIGMGIVFVLLLGEIDLSVGFVSGVGGAICAVLLLPGGTSVPTSVAIIVALGAGLGIGLVQGTLFAKVGIPSFVVTLAGLLAWNGVVLLIVGSRNYGPARRMMVGSTSNHLTRHARGPLLILPRGTAHAAPAVAEGTDAEAKPVSA